MATWIKPKDLELKLRASPIVRELQEQSTVDVAAMLVALADVESSFQVDAIGDKGNSFGLWQINSLVWDFAPARLADVDYQISAVVPVYDQANDAVQKALEILRNRQLAGETSHAAGAGVVETKPIKRASPGDEQPVWYSIIWQYGAGDLLQPGKIFGFKNWIAETFDTSMDGFAAYRKAHGRKLESTFYKRQKTLLSTYKIYSDPASGITGQDADQAGRADFYEDVVAGTGRDLANLPKRALPWVPLGLFAFGLGIAAWSTARRAI